MANLLLFIPFGVYVGLLARSWRWWKAAGIFAGASMTLEIAQYALAVGSSDSTDLIVNTVGGLAGLVLVVASRGRFGRAPRRHGPESASSGLRSP